MRGKSSLPFYFYKYYISETERSDRKTEREGGRIRNYFNNYAKHFQMLSENRKVRLTPSSRTVDNTASDGLSEAPFLIYPPSRVTFALGSRLRLRILSFAFILRVMERTAAKKRKYIRANDERLSCSIFGSCHGKCLQLDAFISFLFPLLFHSLLVSIQIQIHIDRFRSFSLAPLRSGRARRFCCYFFARTNWDSTDVLLMLLHPKVACYDFSLFFLLFTFCAGEEVKRREDVLSRTK